MTEYAIVFKCSVCRYDFDNEDRKPRVLPQCGHTQCTACINRAFEKFKGNTVEKTITCPVDKRTYLVRQDVKKPEGFEWIDDFFFNFQVLSSMGEKNNI